ncbi:MAG: sigma-70 family RNA polymerase sigma factor [Hydrogenoanaerobacterium sp.]
MQDNSLFCDTNLTDEQLAQKAKGACSDELSALFVRYEPIAKSLVKGYNIAGMEQDDLAQEALMGLFKAVRSFKKDRNIPFRAYALICMRRQVNTAVKAGLAGKQQPLSNYVPLDDSDELLYGTQHRAPSPEAIVIMEEEASGTRQQIKNLLSPFEQKTLRLYLSGISYEDIAKAQGTTPKAVDNALQRVRRKLREIKH